MKFTKLAIGIVIIILLFSISNTFILKKEIKNNKTIPSSTPTAIITQSKEFTTKEDCLSQGGTWQRWGLAPKEFCQIPAKDAGKICTDTSQCSAGKCLADIQTKASSGYCAKYQQTFGCYSTIEKGKTTQTICVD